MSNLETNFKKEIGIKFNWSDIDDLILSDANILRPTYGYAFEFLIDEIFRKNFDIKLQEGSGDTDIDRFFIKNSKRITLQIKTPVKKSIKENESFSFSLHKTHGNERRPKNLYPIEFPCPIENCEHEGEPFPDFLIGMHPEKGVMIIPKNQLQESYTYPGHFDDPQKFNWNSEYLNAWQSLGFNEFKGRNLLREKVSGSTEKFPRVSEVVKLNDNELLSLFLKPENFRLLHMNIRGNLREPFVIRMLTSKGIEVLEIDESYPKYDVLTKNHCRIQIKGCSKHLSNVEKKKIGVEVMGTHRQGPDRRYSSDDFDFLCVAIDPKYIPAEINLPDDEYAFAFIGSNALPLHPKNNAWGTTKKIYENCKFKFDDQNRSILYPDITSYRQEIKFGIDEICLNEIPSKILNE